jgi:hypothetical protein
VRRHYKATIQFINSVTPQLFAGADRDLPHEHFSQYLGTELTLNINHIKIFYSLHQNNKIFQNNAFGVKLQQNLAYKL